MHWQLGAVASENLNDSAPPNGTEDEKGSPTPRPGREPAGGQDEMNDEEEATGCERGIAVSPPQWRSSVVLVDETKKEAISGGESGDNKKDQDKAHDKTDKLMRVDGKWNSELFDGMGGFEAKLTGLKAGCNYSLFATTHADEGDVDGVAVSFSAAPSCPARPEEPVICGKGKNFVKLRWTVPSGRGSAVAQYEVEIRNSFQAGSPSAKGSRAKTQQEVSEEEIEMWGCGVQVHQGPETRCEIKGLRPGTSLQARVRAFNAIGASQPSAWITVTTAATVPLAPPCPFVGQANIGNLYFGWYEPADHGGAPIQSYCLEIDEGNGEGFMIKYNGPDQQWLLKNAVCGHPYKVRVKATNEVGSSPCSEVCEAHGLCGPPSPPGPPELIDLPQGMSPSFAMCLRWAPPASDNGSCIQLYQVVMRRIVDGLAVEFFQVVYAGPDMRCQIQGLFPASCYEFGVVAVSLLGTSPPSLTSSFTTAGAPPPPPPPPFLLGIEGGDVNVGWTLPSVCNGSPVSSFVLESLVPHEDLIDEASGQAEWVSSVQYSGSGISYWIKGLNPGIPVWLRVAAVNGYGQGLFSAPVNIMTPCAAPGKVTKVSAIATGPGRACVRWEPPAKNGGMPIIAYKVWVSRKGVGGSDPIQLTVEGGGPTVVEGLVAGTLYQAKVQAMNSMGAGEFSEPFVFSSEAGSPSAPKMPVISHVTTDTIGVSWEKPEQDNGAPVEHFALEMQQTTATLSTESTPASKNPWRVVYKGSFTSFEVGGLEPGGSYRFRVRGRNAAGEGPFSPPVICCTEAVPPGPPLSVTVLSVSAKELKLKWSAPAFNGGSDITSYAVILESAVGEREVYRGEHTKCSVKVSPATVYNLRVIAHTVIGGGTPSIPLTFTTPATVAVGVKVRAPPAMPPPTFSVKGHGVFVSWAHCRDSQPPVVSYHLSAQPEHVSANGRGDPELDDCTPDAYICYSVSLKFVR